ncbi:hypothetical protein [Ferviditalea candida]|uniref:Uncharacterized protein n=1 Tax=Ferviditalea candida TaxID=3108399 RepID=A0ABU5ZQ96_9BACL|nr:hypothetical protein [Paenibacillaceae bacterium T2]
MNRMKIDTLLTKLEQARTDAEYADLRKLFAEGGYSLFSRFVELLRNELKQFEEMQAEKVQEMLRKGRLAVPEPGSISPAWSSIWEELERTAAYKMEALRAIAPEDRKGEWQIIIDNPFSHEPIICHPGLTFSEASYYYGYFRLNLQKNEFIRLQRIVSMLTTSGS